MPRTLTEVLVIATAVLMALAPTATALTVQPAHGRPGPPGSATGEVDATGAACPAHPNIRITEDEGPQGFVLAHDPATGAPIYRPGSGVVAGDGSADDPYVIGGWCLTDAPTNPFGLLVGIHIEATQSHVVIRDNHIQGPPVKAVVALDNYDHGIVVDAASNVTVEGNTVVWTNRAGIVVRDAETATVSNNTVIDTITLDGIWVSDSDGAVIERNTATGNGRSITGQGSGIAVRASAGAVVRHNTVGDNALHGIDLRDSPEVVAEFNTAEDHRHGIHVRGSDGVVVARNTTAGNSLDGVHVRDSDGAAVVGNSATANGRHGVGLALSDGVEVRGNTVTDNARHGISISRQGALTTPAGDHVAANEVAGNTVGIVVVGEVSVTPRANNVHGNGVGLDATNAHGSVNARDNWWGCPDGPAHADCDDVLGKVLYEPWRSAPNPDAGAVAGEETPCGPGTEHRPIRITEEHGPQGFTWTNPATGTDEHRPGSGVVAGAGTQDDPFLIESWCITAPPAGPVVAGVLLAGTSSHVVVRDNVVSGVTGLLESGVVVDGAANVAVVDNTVDAAGYGISLESSPGTSVEGNRVTATEWAGILLAGSHGAAVGDNTVTGNTGHGIHLDSSTGVVVEGNAASGNAGDGIRSTASDTAVVQHNSVSHNTGNGIHLDGSHQTQVRDNTVTDNGGRGVSFVECDGAVVEHNTVTGNDLHGVSFLSPDDQPSNQAVVQGNTATGNRLDGITLRSQGDVRIDGNTVMDNGQWGLRHLFGDVVLVRDNTVTGNRFDGLEIRESESAVVQDNTFTGNRLGLLLLGTPGAVAERNTATHNIGGRGLLGTGISVGSSSPGAVLRHNTVSDNDARGFHLFNSDGVEVQQNTATGNGFAGISVVSSHGVVVRQNTASDNGRVGVHIKGISFGPAEDNHVVANEVARNDVGVVVEGDVPGTVVRGNNISASNDGIGLHATGANHTVDARNNWWGCADGPDHVLCNDVIGDALYTPWLTAPHDEAGRG